MKKILSTFLAVTLLVTSLLTIPFTASAIITNPVIGSGEKLSLSFVKNVDWFSGKQVATGGERDTTLKGNTSYDYVSMPAAFVSNGILAFKEADVTDLTNFEWGIGVDVDSNATGLFGLLFHVNTARTNNPTTLKNFNSVNSIKNCIAIGINYCAPTTAPQQGMRPNSITVFVPDAKTGALVPLNAKEYSAEEVRATYSGYTGTAPMILSDEDSYLSFGSTAFAAAAKIPYTVKLLGNQLTVTVNNTITKTFTLPYSALQLAPSGDFAIASASAAGTKVRTISFTNYPTTEPTSGLIFDSTNLDKDGVVWVNKSNTTAKKANGELLDDATADSTDGSIKIPGGMGTTAILKNNGYTNTTLTDFVWDFQYKPGDAKTNETSFLFHVDENRSIGSGYYKTRLVTGDYIGLKYDPPLDKNKLPRQYLAATMYGSSDNFDSLPYAHKNALTIDWCQNSGEFLNAGTGSSADKALSYLEIKTVDDNGQPQENIRDDVYYNVRIAMNGATVVASVWQEGHEAETLSQTVCTYDSRIYCLDRYPSGDFAIVQENEDTWGNIKNMKIYDGTEEFESDEDYSEYEDFNKIYNFGDPSDIEGLELRQTEASAPEHKLEIVDGKLKITSDEQGHADVVGFDSNNTNLRDFIIKYELTEVGVPNASGNGFKGHDFVKDELLFRISRDGHYKLVIDEQGENPTIISLVKVVANDEPVTLATMPISKGYICNEPVTVKLSAIGGEIKVWIAGNDAVYNTPIISVTDAKPLTYGYISFNVYKHMRLLDNICIYDITAKELSDKFEDMVEGFDNITRGDKKEVKQAAVQYSYLSEIQKERLIEYKDVIDQALAEIDELDKAAHDINEDGVVDILDLVLCDVGSENAIAKDPNFNGKIDDMDLWSLRCFILGLSIDPEINVLTIGNSYSIDMNQYVGRLAASLGYEGYNFESLYYAGRSINNHYKAIDDVNGDYTHYIYNDKPYSANETATMKGVLESKDWDIIIFQTSPIGAAKHEGENTDFEGLLEYVRSEVGSQVKLMWENSWAYATTEGVPEDVPEKFTYNASVLNSLEGWTFLDGEDGEYSRAVMEQRIKDQLVKYFGKDGMYSDYITLDDVVPVGLAIDAARYMQEEGKDFVAGTETAWDLTRDGYHLSHNMGRYIAALTLLEKVTGDDIVYDANIYRDTDVGAEDMTEEEINNAIAAKNQGYEMLEALKK